MMKWLFSGMILLSLVAGAINGRMDAVTDAALRECGNAVEFALGLTGSMILWSGLMKITDRSGLTEKISRLCAPVIRRLFTGLNCSGAAAKAIALNLSANLLGLGNAATPLGIAAMRELAAAEECRDQASDHMVLFVVLNTTSLQLLPTTIALLRAEAGAIRPLDILPAVWCVSCASILSGILMAKLLSHRDYRSPLAVRSLRGHRREGRRP